jgi:heterodisulfide reductase subunit C
MGVEVDGAIRAKIERATGAGAALCWTCSSCDAECPVNIATGRLRPQRVVRLANLGLAGELIASPEIWYCAGCRRCSRICPNAVQPETVIRYARAAAVRCGVVAVSAVRRFQELYRRFQRLRRQAARACLAGAPGDAVADSWEALLAAAPPPPAGAVAHGALFRGGPLFREAARRARAADCFACGECSSACPVSGEVGTFDPRWVFRMANLGLSAELLRSPALWLCLQCGRCTAACTQGVDGCALIADLRQAALREGAVAPDFPERFAAAERPLYRRLLAEIDRLCGVPVRGGLACEPAACIPEALYG